MLGRGTAAALGLMLVGGSAAAASNATAAGFTAGGESLAHHALLRRAELGHGWTADAPAPKPVPLITCLQFSPVVLGIHQTGAAATPRFQRSANGPFVSQTAYSYASPSQARRQARAEMRRGLLRCLAASLTQQSSSSLIFTVKHRRVLPKPATSLKAAAYRVSGSASQADQTVDVYLDAILMRSGRTITELSIATFLQPPGRSLERRLTRRIAARIGP